MVDQSCKPWLDHPVGRPSPIFAWHHPCVSLRLRKSQSLPAEDGANQRIKEALHFNFNATSQLRQCNIATKTQTCILAMGRCTWHLHRYVKKSPCYACYPFHPCAFYASRGRHRWLSLSHCGRIGAVKSVFITVQQRDTSLIQVVTWDIQWWYS